MALVELPPLQIIKGQPSFFSAVFMQGDEPVDFTGWSGEFMLAREYRGRTFWKAPVTLGTDGSVSLTIPADETDVFCAFDRRGHSDVVGIFQVTLTAPLPEFNEVWQGNVAVAGVLK